MAALPRIAIVGGGPAGLALGVLLRKSHIPFTIFELRQKPTQEELAKPSGNLDLHEGSGLAVINACGLSDDFLPLTGECSEDFIVANRDGKVLFTMPGDGKRPEISRNNLTKLLLDNVPEESVKWGHKLLSAKRLTTSDHSETELDFGDNGRSTFDLVIGADGAWSMVRKLLSDVNPHFTGMHNIAVTVKNITKKYPHLASLVGSGSFSVLGNRNAVISQRGTMDSARVYVWLTHADESFATTFDLAGRPASSAKETLLGDDALLGTFGSTIKELVATVCDEEAADNPGSSLDIRALYTLPHGFSWEHQAGVTVIGDAAHLMLPNGEGVNQAMFDAFLLSEAIIKAWGIAGENSDSFYSVFDGLLKACEAALVDRAKETGIDTDGLIGKMFGSDDAAYDVASFLQSAMQDPSQRI